MADRGEQSADVGVVDSGDGVAEVDGDAACEAGGQEQDASFAAGAWELAGVQGGDGGVPVDVCHRSGAVADAGGSSDEAAGEVVAA